MERAHVEYIFGKRRNEFAAYAYWNCAAFYDLSSDYDSHAVHIVRANANPNTRLMFGWVETV